MKKNIAVYPGTFDPVTNGHLDIINRAALLFDKVIVAVLVNQNKKTIFSVKERLKHLKETTKDIPNVEVDFFDGLLVEYMKKKGSRIAVRGLRAVSDLEYEFQMANTNRVLNKEMDTIFLMPRARYTYLSSSMVREVYSLGGRLQDYVPAIVEKALIKHYKNK
jgi:pantetheine-phosphate adenylyltransferase